MTEKEKLIKILSIPIYPREGAPKEEVIADYLLGNDVVPVVRCKNCKLFNNCIPGESMLICGITDGFCAAGVSR